MRTMATSKKNQQTALKAQASDQRKITHWLPPPRLYYSFADALKIVQSEIPNCTADHLLYCGLMGKVKFFLHVPYRFNVYAVSRNRVEWNKRIDTPRLLILGGLDCGAIEWSKKTYQSSFHSGYEFDGNSFNVIFPTLTRLEANPEFTWSIFEKGSNSPFRINQPDLRSECNAQPTIWEKAIDDQNSRNGIETVKLLCSAPDQVDIQNAKTNPSAKAVALTITEKMLFVMHDELRQLIKDEVALLNRYRQQQLVDSLAQEIPNWGGHEETLYQRTLSAGQSVCHQFKIPEQSNDYLSRNIYFTLEEAVVAATPQHPECTAGQLLAFGSTNKLMFITPVPVGVDLIAVNVIANPRCDKNITSDDAPRFLVVESAECLTIMREGKVSAGRFKRGHNYDFNTSIDIFPDGSPDGRNNILLQWATSYLGQFHEIEIPTDRLFLVQSDLANLVLTESGPWTSVVEEQQDVHERESDQSADNVGSVEKWSPSTVQKAIANSSERRPSMISECEVIKRIGRSRTTINAYQDRESRYYDPSFPKKRKVVGSARNVEYVESEIVRWGNDHPRPK